MSEICYISGEGAESPGRKTLGRVWRSFRGGRGGGKEVGVGVEAPPDLMIPVGKLGHCGKNRSSFQTQTCGGKISQRQGGVGVGAGAGGSLKGSPSLSRWRPAGHRLLACPSPPPVSPLLPSTVACVFSVQGDQSPQSVAANLHLLLFARLVWPSSEVLEVAARLMGQLCIWVVVRVLWPGRVSDNRLYNHRMKLPVFCLLVRFQHQRIPGLRKSRAAVSDAQI